MPRASRGEHPVAAGPVPRDPLLPDQRGHPTAPGTQTAQKQDAGLPYPDAQPSAASIRALESAQRHTTFDSTRRDGSVD